MPSFFAGTQIRKYLACYLRVHGVRSRIRIDGLAKRIRRYAIFLTEVPERFRGVSDPKVSDLKIVLTEKETNKNLRLQTAQI
jgi:hypothetical protein